MYRIRETGAVELTQGSLKSSMGKHLMANNKRAYSAHHTLSITPDGIPSGAPALREALSDRELRVRSSIFYPCNPCVPRSGTSAKKTQGFNDFNDFNVLNESAAGGR